MNRRNFLQLAGATAGASVINRSAALPQGSKSGVPSKALMKVGTQHGSSDDILEVLCSLGVNNICGSLPSAKMDAAWSVEALTKLRERVESYGIHLDMIPLPLSSAYITKAELPSIMMAKSPDRDRDIDTVCQMIRNASRAGIPSLKYNMSILGVVRTESTPGRGRSRYSTFVYDKAKQEPPLTEAGPVNPDAYWERITYFLERVVPVAAEHKIRIACHPHDPGMPYDKGYRGVHTVLGSVDGLKKFLSIKENPYHGLNFCQGTVSEMLQDPGKEILDVIRDFGSRKKIFNVHFRNIKGKFLNFQETYIDNGDVDMLKAMRVYKEVGYDGMMMPDHVPRVAADPKGLQAFAYSFGYIKALIAAVNAEG
jgi:mannonate dehydratase